MTDGILEIVIQGSLFRPGYLVCAVEVISCLKYIFTNVDDQAFAGGSVWDDEERELEINTEPIQATYRICRTSHLNEFLTGDANKVDQTTWVCDYITI